MKAFLLFALSGTLAFLLDYAVLWIGFPSLGAIWGRALSFSSAVLFTWWFNRQFTFKAKSQPVESTSQTSEQQPRLWQRWGRELAHYYLCMLGGGAVNFAVYYVALLLLRPPSFLPIALSQSQQLLISLALGSGAGLVVNFISAKYWIFKHRQSH